MKVKKIFYWFARIVAAVLLFQTLFFKFTAAEESVFIFTTVGMEPWGRIGVGVLELVAAIALAIPRTGWIGAGLSASLMAGAIMMHLTLLGISVRGDGGYLFFLALLILVCNVFVLWMDHEKIIAFVKNALPIKPFH